MWLRECYRLFPELIEMHTRQKQNLEQVEREVRQAKPGNQISATVLQIIETSGGWTYPAWWPVLSEKIKEPIKLPASLLPPKAKRDAIELLYARLQHIEVVSVVLRFLCPEEFGILSPPVMNLVNLPRARNHVDLYCRYVSLLTGMREHYGELKRVADFDMALWSAAHLDPSSNRLIWSQILHDPYFQGICLGNLLEGFGRSWGQSDRERLLLANILLDHDHTLAALIAGRCFSVIIRLMIKKWNMDYLDPQADLLELVKELQRSKQKELLRDLGISASALDPLRLYRNFVVHAHPIQKNQAEALVKRVTELLARLESS